MAKTVAERLEEARKKRQQGESNEKQKDKSSGNSVADRLKKSRAERTIGFDTLSDDVNALGNTINAMYSGWQDAKTMESNRDSLSTMLNRLSTYTDYMNSYGRDMDDFDSHLKEIQGVYDSFNSVYTGFDDWVKMYGEFDSAENYNSYITEQKKEQDRREKERKELLALDTNAYASELDNSKTAVAELQKQRKNLIDAYGMGGDDSTILAKVNEIDNQIAELDVDGKKAYLWKAQNLQKYNGLSGNSDWNAQSVNKNHQFGFWDVDSTYNYINDIDNERAKSSGRALMSGVSSGNEIYSYMTDDEVASYNYLYNTEGKDSANEYLKYLEYELSERRKGVAYSNAKHLANEAPFLADLTSVTGTLMSGVGYLDALGQKIGNSFTESVTGKYAGPINYNSGAMLPSVVTSSIRGQRAKNITNDWGVIKIDEKSNPILHKMFDGKGLGDLYQLGMSMVDSAAVAGLTAMGLPGAVGLLGGSAATQGMLDAAERGATDEQALIMGALSGAAEMLFEKYEIDGFLDKISKGKMGGILTQMLTEGTGEAATSVTNMITDSIIMGANSNWQASINSYMEQNPNMTEEEATRQALLDAIIQTGWDFVGGAVMGGLTTAGGIAVNTAYRGAMNVADRYTAGKQILNADGGAKALEELSKQVYGMATEDSTKADIEKLSKKVTDKKGIVNQMNVGKLYQTVQTAVTEQNITDIAKSLERKGFSPEDAKSIAGALAVSANGLQLSEKQTELLKTYAKDERVQKTFRDVVANPNSTTGQTRQKVSNLSKEVLTNTVGKSTEATGAKNAQGESISTHSKYDVSVDGKTHLRGQDEVIDSYEIADIKDGKVTLKLATGDVVSADDVSFSSNGEALMVEAFADVGMSADGANAFLQSINSDNGLSVAKGIKEVFAYGSVGYPMEAMSNLGFSSALTKTQQEYLHTLAQEKAQKATDKAQGAVDKAFNDAVKYLKDHNIDAGRKHGTVSFEKGAMVSQTKADAQQKKRQTEAIEAAKVLAYITGLDFVFYSSGQGSNGRYDPKTGKVHIDLLAGFDANSLCMYTISHELLHFAKQMSPQKYKMFSQMVLDAFTKSEAFQKRGWTLDDLIQNQIDAVKEDGRKLTWDEAYEEVIADACESLLVDEGFEQLLSKIEARDKGLFNELKQFFQKLLRKLKNFFTAYSNVDPNSFEANIIRSMTDEVQKIVDAFTDMLQDASQKNATIRAAQDAGMEMVQALGEYGIGYDADTQSVFASRHSFATNEMLKIGRKSFDAESVAKMVSKVTGRSIEDARKWVQSEVTIANMVLANPEFLDFIPDNRYEAIKKNSDYPQGTVDLSNLCPKREEFTAMFDLLQKTYPDKLFTADDVAEMRKILKSNGITVACGACFVEDRRQLLGEIADTYIGMWKEAIQSGKTLHKVNAEGKKVALYVTGNIAKQYKSIGVKQGDAIMATDKYVPTQYDLTTYEGFKNLQKNHPTIAMGFERYNNSRGQQAARLIEGRAEYDRQILNWSAAKVKSVNNNGGLRIFSFSDFEVVHLLDLVQVIIDCAAKGVKIQGYTKIPAFARLIRNTGIKINRSLIPKGDLGFHMENGKIVLDYDTTEGIDINDENFLDEHDNPNVGNILIGINPEQIGAAMLDDFVDYIIPFHSNKAYAILKKLGTGAWFNYKNSQHDKDIATGKSSAKMVNIYPDVIAKYNPTNKVEFVEAFINECKAQGKIPRYEEFLNREYTEDGVYTDADGRAYNYTYREGYHKLIVDFKMFDKAGNILPQTEIAPDLDEGFMADLLTAEVKKKKSYEFPQEVYDAIDKKFGKNSLDNSAAGNENKLTENHNRGELSDNRGIREGASQDTGVPETDRGRHSENAGASQEAKSWDRQSRLVKNRLVGIVDSHIKAAKSQEEVFTLVSVIANISKDELTTNRGKNAIQKVAEQIYSDAMTLHPMLFDDKWRLLGKANELRSKVIAATKDSDPSRKDTDSDGNQISKEQQEFFEDTKVVDKNGKLLVMYHGSSSRTMFTVFERRPLINGKNYGEGYYFTEVKNEAYGWGSSFVHTVYVNLSNPYYASTDMEAPEAIVELVKKQLGATYDKLSQDANWWGSKLTREEYIEKNSYRWRDAEIALTHAVDETDIPEDGFLEEVARRKTELLKSLKYDGVIVTTNKLNRNFQEVVAFDSNQIKFITNKNPTKDIDMRYSSRKTDRDYLSAVKRGDMETAQRMVDEAAKKAGYNSPKLYHGTSAFGFTKIDTKKSNDRISFFATDSMQTAKTYSGTSIARSIGDASQSSLGMYQLYANTDGMVEFDANGAESNHIALGQAEKDYNDVVYGKSWYSYATAKQLAKYAKQKGYAGVIIKNVVDSATPQSRKSESPSNVYIFFNPKTQVKSADPVTYDDDGNVIPLSERFNTENDDIRYSSRKQPANGNASNRYILANALENAVKNPTEMEWLSTYKANYAEADALEQQLQDINRQIKDLTFSTGNRDKSKMEELKNKQKILTNKLKRIDGKLLKIEASKPLADLLAREKARVEKDVKAKAQKSRQETLMIRNNNIMRHKIQSVVKDIDKLLYRGNKDKNVKLGLQDTISKALQFADVLFAPTPSNAEVLRSASVDMSAAEESSVNKYLAYSDRRDAINAKLKEIRDGVRSAEEYALALDDAQPKIEALEAERAQVQKEIDRISKEIAEVIERARRKVDEASTVSDAINDLAMAYKRLEGTDISYLNGAYDDFVYDHIILLEQEIGNTNIRDMNEKQLLQVYDMFKMMQVAIRDANKLFLNGKKQEKEFLGYNTITEVTASGKAKESRSDLTAGLRKFGWNTLTIDTVVEILDSSTLKAVVDDIKSAQGVYAKDTADAKEFFTKVAEEVGYWNWDKDKTYTFTATNGGEFSIGIEAMMLLYAYSKRKQAVSHLEGKGFSLRGTKKSTKLGSRTINDSTTYIVMEEKIAEVVGVMEKEYPGAKKYVEKLQEYLSTTMGAKGNEVSEFLYGIDLFVEEYYVPLMTDSQFLDPQDMDKKQGAAGFRRKNSGFTKATVKNATKAITLGNFTEVWSGHVVEMANYHAMVIPLDTMEKLLNFHDGTVSVHGTIEHNWGSEAVQYLRDYINDLNGGIQADKRGGFFEGLIGLQKMSAVALSASVVVQQPTAIFRAMQEIDPKYFLVAPKKNGFEQLKQYSPIAVIKQMGGFDTHTGRGAGSWIVAQEYKGLKGKVKGLLTDKDYRSEAYFWMAGKADEVTWAWIWQAILRETKAKHPGLVVGSKEFMEAAGKRADDVLSRTQVYDSTVSKSGLMRSSDGITKMATAFLGEPTVGINNLVYGFVKGKHIGGAKGTKYFLGVASSVVVAQIAASFAKAFVQAARDDDEDKTYWEKYLDKSTDNLVSDVLLMIPNSIPYVRDLVSMWQGWDIERTDMALLGDLIDAIKAWDSDRKTIEEKISQTAGAIGNLFGIPIKNVYRDIKALVNVISEMLS